MSPLPYMALYVADYLADTAHLTAKEHGAYLLLIMNYFQRGKPLPADAAKLARIARLSIDEWDEIAATIREFFVEKDGVWYHKRIAAELQKVAEKSSKARTAGKASAASRSGIAQRTFNGCSAILQRTSNQTDTDTYTDSYEQNEKRSVAGSLPSSELNSDSDDVVREAFESYNAIAREAQLPVAQQLTDERRKKIRARLQECGGLAGWVHAIEKIGESPFLCGKNDRGWKATIDFVLRRETFTRLLEGNYDRRDRLSSKQQHRSISEIGNIIDAVAEEAIERADQ